MEGLISLKEATQRYGLSPAWFYQRTSARMIPHHKIGRSLFFQREELDSWFLKYSRREAV